MSKTNDGGPAFPGGFRETDDDNVHPFYQGMTLRDYFAAKAMQAYSSSPEWRVDMPQDGTALAAYRMADAMLRAREAA